MTQLSYDGRIASELTRRIGMASRAFADLQKVWNYANVSKDKKSRIYHACIVPMLMYGLQACWLNQAELKRLDAFHYKCMRRILKIPHSYIRRVTNYDVGVQSNSIRLNLQLLKHQMMLYGL